MKMPLDQRSRIKKINFQEIALNAIVMKRTLVLLASVAVLFAACKKKTTFTNSYYCIYIDSAVSNIPTLDTTYIAGSDTLSGYTNDRINAYILTHFSKDTVYNNTDTAAFMYRVVRCTQL
jgi:hypothetical protein